MLIFQRLIKDVTNMKHPRHVGHVAHVPAVQRLEPRFQNNFDMLDLRLQGLHLYYTTRGLNTLRP